MIFCRTNVDCDNLEIFLNNYGGGSGKGFEGKMEKGKVSVLSEIFLVNHCDQIFFACFWHRLF